MLGAQDRSMSWINCRKRVQASGQVNAPRKSGKADPDKTLERRSHAFWRPLATSIPTRRKNPCLDRDRLLAFNDFPAAHWQHLKNNNSIESDIANIRLKVTAKTRNCLQRSESGLALIASTGHECTKRCANFEGSGKWPMSLPA